MLRGEPGFPVACARRRSGGNVARLTALPGIDSLRQHSGPLISSPRRSEAHGDDLMAMGWLPHPASLGADYAPSCERTGRPTRGDSANRPSGTFGE